MICAMTITWPVSAADLAERGKSIAIEADKRSSGFGAREESFVMHLRDRGGNERTRQLRVKILERPEGHDWSLTIFDQPGDVKGTAFLTHTNGLEDDDQWIYLPSLKRVKRISSKNKSGHFMGSEFAFEDMSAFAPEKYAYKFHRMEACGDLECYVSEWIPLYQNSGYARHEVWHDAVEYRTQRIDYYDEESKSLKMLVFSDYKIFKGQFWLPMTLEMTSHQTGKSTLLTYESYDFDVALDAGDFDQNALKRAK